MQGTCSCIREKGTWMETFKQMSVMKKCLSARQSPQTHGLVPSWNGENK